jgi:hypothetical protein
MYIMYTRTIYKKVKFALKGMCHRIVNHWIRTGMCAQQVYCLSPIVHVSSANPIVHNVRAPPSRAENHVQKHIMYVRGSNHYRKQHLCRVSYALPSAKYRACI